MRRLSCHPLPLTLGLLGLLTLACAKTPEVVSPAYVPTYAFTPPTSTAGSGVSIGIVNPQLTEAVKSSIAMSYMKMGMQVPVTGGEDPSYRAMRDAVGRSLLQYFTSSGFTVSGPFASVDMMTFPEKKQSDLVLTVEFGVVTDQPQTAVLRDDRGNVSLVASRGACTVAGSIVFVLWEPLSMQRMWAKSVEVTPSTFDCTFQTRSAEVFNVLLGNGFSQAFEQVFRATMDAAVRYFNPEEVALVKSQARELRDKKVY